MIQPAFIQVARPKLVQVWMVVKLSGERTQYCIVGLHVFSTWKCRKVILLGPKHLRDTLSNDIATLGITSLASSTVVRNLGLIFEQDLSFNSHMFKHILKTAFFRKKQEHPISKTCRKGSAFVTSWLDYCNSLSSGWPTSLWHPVKHRIECKILLLTYIAFIARHQHTVSSRGHSTMLSDSLNQWPQVVAHHSVQFCSPHLRHHDCHAICIVTFIDFFWIDFTHHH